MYINEVTLYGRLGADPELKALPSGNSVCNFRMATTRTWKEKDSGAKKEETEWSNVVCFGRRGEVIAQYVKKGHAILIKGRLQTRSWDKDGVKMYRTEVVCEDFQFGDNKKEDGERGTPPPSPRGSDIDDIQYPDDDVNPEDIPF